MHRKTQPGPYKYDDDEDYVPTKKVKHNLTNEKEDIARVKKHTLDSDEDDEEEDEKKRAAFVLKDEDIDGQEAATIAMEGETKITPFNMKEEMEEGHFDKDGFYHFKKGTETLKDAWLDNIDWIKVKQDGENVHKYGSDVDSDSDDESTLLPRVESQKERESLIRIYEAIFPYLQKGETISKSLKRLGGNTKRLSSSERWKLKKQGKLESATGGNMDEFLKLTELVNKIICTGNMDIYQETYEMINLKIERFKAAFAEPTMDMFSDEVTSTSKEEKTVVEADSQQDTFGEVMWEYRWENKDDAEIHGPFTTEQMIRWKEESFFKKDVYIRKTSQQSGPWYLSSRIDFDLYI